MGKTEVLYMMLVSHKYALEKKSMWNPLINIEDRINVDVDIIGYFS
jgi:hypothetical protein